MFERDIACMTLPVTDIQRFCMHDGPGVRTVVFLKGCPLRCAWCHNPEGKRMKQEILFYESKCIGCGACCAVCSTGAQMLLPTRSYERDKCVGCTACAEVCCTEALVSAKREMSISEVMDVISRDRAFYGEVSNHGRTLGGVTVSGGEPMAHPDETLALLDAARKAGFSTAVETCGHFDPAYLPYLADAADLLLWDVKDTDAHRHKQYTGVSNEQILANLREIDRLGGHTRLRCILVAGVNTYDEHYAALSRLALSLQHCEGVEFLPYHAYSGSKMLPLGMPDNGIVDWIPTPETVEYAKCFLRECGVVTFG